MSGVEMALLIYLLWVTLWLAYLSRPRPASPPEAPIPACGCWPEHAQGGHPRTEYLPLIARDPRTGNLREVDKCSICGQPKLSHPKEES